MIWTGTKEQFDGFMTRINALHPTIKFTHSFDLTNKSVTFLDTTIQIRTKRLKLIFTGNQQTESNIFFQAQAIQITSLPMFLTL